jgi:tetratricopeptide (TPR) repeat protein
VAVNRTKVLEAAQKFQSKGQYDKAIAEYQKLVVEDPRDVRTLLKIGDLHTRRNKPKDAIDVYEKVAELYAKQGFFLKGVAVYKQILKLDAGHLPATLKLAQMYEELALASDALSTYEQAADAFLAQGQIGKALDTMERMIALDGQNVAARIKYAEALSKADRAREAAAAFADGARLLREQGRIDDYIRVIERQLYHDPENVEIARELSGRYLERADPKRALAKLQVCFKADPRNVQTLEMLAEAFRQLGQIPKTISVLKEIARLHGEVHAEEPRRRTLLRVLDLDPSDVEAKQVLASTGTAAKAPAASAGTGAGHASRTGMAPADVRAGEVRPAPQLTPQPSTLRGRYIEEPSPDPDEGVFIEAEEESPEEDEELSLLDAEEEEEERGAGDAQLLIAEDSVAEPAPEPSRQRDTSISGLLVAAEGYESNGEYEHAEEVLLRAIELNPEHVDAHERLKDIYLASDRRVEAVRELLWLSDAWTERDPAQARRYARAAFELAPNAAATRNRLSALGVYPETPESEGAQDEVVFVDDATEASHTEANRLEPSTQDLLSSDQGEFGGLSQTDRQRPMARSASSSPPEGSYDPLEIPIRPDEFEARPHQHELPLARPELASLLDRPFLPEEFEQSEDEHAAPFHEHDEDRDVAALLDAPMSPEEFDAGEPAQREPETQFPHARERTREPVDDFGLSDASFDRSDLHEVTPAPGFAEKPASRHALEAMESGSYAELQSADVDLNQAGADGGQTLKPGASPYADSPSLEAELPELDDDLLISAEDSDAHRGQFASLADVEQAHEETDFLGEIPEPTLPAQPIPELIRRSSQDDLEAIRIEGPAAEIAEQPSAAVFKPALPAPPIPREVLTPEIEEALDEAEFFASQGLADEALDVVQEAILIYPHSAFLKSRFREYEAAVAARSAAEGQREDEHALDESFDIAEQLASVEVPAAPADDEMVDVESVFAQFKKGVAQQIAADDTDTHFDLGIAYKEMGLLEDAISEFDLSAKSSKRACIALTMVGMCHMEKGDPLKAVTFFERALAQPMKTSAEEVALLYEIGGAQEASGQLDKALSTFEKVAARDRTFRGVSGRIEQLKRRAGSSSGASRVSR